jgi:hypothetical protein
MKRSYWGEFEDETVKKKELRENEIILPISKIDQFRTLKIYPNTEAEKKYLNFLFPRPTTWSNIYNVHC